MITLFARSWWILTLRGIVALFYALAAIVWTGATPILLMLLLTMYAFVDGILGIIAAFESPAEHGQRSLLLPMGLAGIAAGRVALIWPQPSPSEFFYLVAGWALAAGILEAIAGIRLHRSIRSGWLMALKGIGLAILGLVFIAWSDGRAVDPRYLVALGTAISGTLAIIAAFRLGNWSDSPVPRLK